MFESFLGIIVIVVLIVMVAKQQSRLGLLERELGALRSLVLSGIVPAAKTAEIAAETAGEPTASEALPAALADTTAQAEPAIAAAADATVTAELPLAAEAEAVGPWSEKQTPAGPAPTPARDRPDIETALGTRWAVWVGGLALAFGAVFLIRHSIASGLFGPGARLSMAALFGLVLVGGGEFIRRTGFRVPVQNGGSAYIPAILTAAGAFTLFGTIYAAHGLYGFIGAGSAFVLLGIVGVATIAAALAHGQALAGLGLLGAMVTPALISSTAPNFWALFGYLAIVQRRLRPSPGREGGRF